MNFYNTLEKVSGVPNYARYIVLTQTSIESKIAEVIDHRIKPKNNSLHGKNQATDFCI